MDETLDDKAKTEVMDKIVTNVKKV